MIDGEKDEFQAVGDTRVKRRLQMACRLRVLSAAARLGFQITAQTRAEDGMIIRDEIADFFTRTVHTALTGAKSPVAPRRQEPIRSPDRRRSSARVP